MKLRVKARLTVVIMAALLLLIVPSVAALGSQQNPQSGTFGLEGTVPGKPPTRGATIAIPSNGQVFTSMPITVSGLCPSDLLVKIFANNVFVGSTMCVSGSYSLKVTLFSGRNDLVARVYDTLDQAGPDSNTVSVIFNDAQFAQFSTHVTLSSNYARLGVDPGVQLSWPVILSGGRGPYALSVDWGDGSGLTLKSVNFPGVINLSHTYSQSGVYTIIIRATDANGASAYLQVIGIVNGKINGSLSLGSSPLQNACGHLYVILWQPMLAVIPLLIIAFWLGRRHELYAIRKQLEAVREQR